MKRLGIQANLKAVDLITCAIKRIKKERMFNFMGQQNPKGPTSSDFKYFASIKFLIKKIYVKSAFP